ncbi:hypothetical protein MTBUT4_110108 [Magnetospirillum sp. UT-4]|nr:hypothetical protein MTBUT4_110108 [Magnetospirillum sp. UT-4]
MDGHHGPGHLRRPGPPADPRRVPAGAGGGGVRVRFVANSPDVQSDATTRRSRAGGNPGVAERVSVHPWIPAFAGMTGTASGFPAIPG